MLNTDIKCNTFHYDTVYIQLISYKKVPGVYTHSVYLSLVHKGTAGFIKKVLSVYTHSMTTIYLSLSAQVAKSTFFMKSPVAEGTFFMQSPVLYGIIFCGFILLCFTPWLNVSILADTQYGDLAK